MPAFQDEASPLERYGHNLTALAQQGAFSPLAGCEAVVNRVFQILLRNNKCNPMLLDFDEARRWAVMAEVVRRLAVGDAPEHLSKRQVIALDYEALFTNLPEDMLIRQERRRQWLETFSPASGEQKSDEEWWAGVERALRWPQLDEWVAPTLVLERLQSMFIALHEATGSFLLFVDHTHRLLGGESDRYPIDARMLLKPALARRQVQLIGACNLTQYRQYIERDAAVQRRFQEVCLPAVQ